MNSTGRQGDGQEITMINPVICRPRGNEMAEEGCLSLPNIHGNVIRAKTVRVNAFTMSGEEIDQDFSGYEARIVQHETDHLDGVLFIDRLKEGAEAEILGELEQLQVDFESRQRTGSLANNVALQLELVEWEQAYC
jgi:peptide deformylase